ncbi:hypothetical protein WJX74_007125 [Apatococcus lobatus]|uniref:Uncharacterized protein n=2 Tax=Apatococcus TaxID=904362 RepID=A0AAW1S549_9CHLO
MIQSTCWSFLSDTRVAVWPTQRPLIIVNLRSSNLAACCACVPATSLIRPARRRSRTVPSLAAKLSWTQGKLAFRQAAQRGARKLPAELSRAPTPQGQPTSCKSSSRRVPPWSQAIHILHTQTKDLVWAKRHQPDSLIHTVSQELEQPHETTAGQLQQLLLVLPTLSMGLTIIDMRICEWASLFKNIDLMAERLLQLQGLLPHIDVGVLAGAKPSVLLKDPKDILLAVQLIVENPHGWARYDKSVHTPREWAWYLISRYRG